MSVSFGRCLSLYVRMFFTSGYIDVGRVKVSFKNSKETVEHGDLLISLPRFKSLSPTCSIW